MTRLSLCPCASGKPFAACCEPFIQGKIQAPTAEALMRSRYTAYAKKQVDYLLKTWHADTRPKQIRIEEIPEWKHLAIMRVEDGSETDHEGTVAFTATAITHGKAFVLHETSCFKKENNQWFYVDGHINEQTNDKPVKVGRNSPCPCNSGKKFKKCCG